MKKKKLLTDKSGELQEKYLEESAKELADDIDFEIVTGFLTETGWTKVVLAPMTWEHGTAVDTWVETNIKGQFHTRGLVWVFEDVKEASWFTLRWLS